jgi:LysM repeat protein
MAIALVADVDPESEPCLADPAELPWPRPVLRLVVDDGPVHREVADPRLDHPSSGRSTTEVSLRRQRRALRRHRQHRTAAIVAVAGAIGLLSLPLGSLAGRPLAVHPAAATAASAGAITYVVQPGDTLWSIAARFDHSGDPRALAEQLQAQSGSANVLPGERLLVP